MDKFVTSIKENTIESLVENITNAQETYQKELEDMKLYNKKRIMKIVLIIFKHLIKRPHLKFSPKAPKVVEPA